MVIQLEYAQLWTVYDLSFSDGALVTLHDLIVSHSVGNSLTIGPNRSIVKPD